MTIRKSIKGQATIYKSYI